MELYSGNLEGIEYSIRAIEALAAQHAKGRKMYYLNIGDPVKLGVRTPKSVCDAACTAVSAGRNGYSHSFGCPEGRQAVSEFYGSKGITAPSEDIYLTSGVSEAMSLLYTALFNSGDSISLPRPYYPLYENLAQLNRVRIHYYELDDDGIPDIASLRESIKGDTKACVLINPNNPMGSCLSRKQVDEIRETVLSRGSILISDEIYSEIIYGGQQMAYAMYGAEEENIITLGGISKSHLVPGWRCGWAVFGRSKQMLKLRNNFEKLLQMRLCPPAPFQYALPAILKDTSFFSDYLSLLKRNAAIVQKHVSRSGGTLSVGKIDAAFYAFIKMNWKAPDSAALARHLIMGKGVVVVPGTGFGKEGYFRVVFACDSALLEEAMEKVIEGAQELAK
ncbi:MAG: pyridoxal phosphate-dependent aminotransferase [Candidatus Micrarchaeota archaeon]|nr:pyridoxal phosphate-dependent aminotransferase [Candidatus Micrarchaeota archaeon]